MRPLHESRPALKVPLIAEVAVAKDAGLRYVTDELSGIARQHRGKAFTYRLPEGALVRASPTLRRIHSLAIPPAWISAWGARLVRRCQHLPGQDLFGYADEDGTVHDVTSEDVNGYIQDIAGDDFSAKDFRTWAGTILAAIALRECGDFTATRHAKRNVIHAIESVAKMFGNTPAICDRCYVHPAILDGYLAAHTIATLQQSANEHLRGSLAKLRPEEAAVMMLLRGWLAVAGPDGGIRYASFLTRKRYARRK